MKTNPMKEGSISDNSTGLGTVTPAMVQALARELAAINGHSAHETSQSEREEAKRELTGDADPESNEAVLEAAPESDRWEPVSGSVGHRVPIAPSEDEDDEGRSDHARLVDEGIPGAEHDQRRQAALE